MTADGPTFHPFRDLPTELQSKLWHLNSRVKAWTDCPANICPGSATVGVFYNVVDDGSPSIWRLRQEMSSCVQTWTTCQPSYCGDVAEMRSCVMRRSCAESQNYHPAQYLRREDETVMVGTHERPRRSHSRGKAWTLQGTGHSRRKRRMHNTAFTRWRRLQALIVGTYHWMTHCDENFEWGWCSDYTCWILLEISFII